MKRRLENFHKKKVPEKQAQVFSPYEINGGTIIGISGADYAVIACDTRLTSGYSINTRHQNKLAQLTPKTILGSVGCWCDSVALTALLQLHIKKYQLEHYRQISTEAISNLMSIMMYSKRFFPYYVSNILAGLDKQGKGILYCYDPLGNCQIIKYRAAGTAAAMLLPILDRKIGGIAKEPNEMVPLQKSLQLIRDAFKSAAERDIYTGDSVIINIITKDGIETEEFELRKD